MNNEALHLHIDVDSTKRYFNNKNEFHREDGPAIEWADGERQWYINGKLHRTDGPAIEYVDGNKSWFVNGKYHRTDGPAIENINGYEAWLLNGQKLTKEEFLAHPLCTIK